MNVVCRWMWCEDVDTYHGRGRLRPEGLRVIAHLVHYGVDRKRQGEADEGTIAMALIRGGQVVHQQSFLEELVSLPYRIYAFICFFVMTLIDVRHFPRLPS